MNWEEKDYAEIEKNVTITDMYDVGSLMCIIAACQYDKVLCIVKDI